MNGLLLKNIANTLEYPTSTTAQKASDAAQQLAHDMNSFVLRDALENLSTYLHNAPNGEPEEHYTTLFDLKPVCTLNLGHHLFGDTYQRGALLAGLATELKTYGISTREDLPDFLPTLLQLLAAFPTDEDRVHLTHVVILPALKKINHTLLSSKSPWARILTALAEWLEHVVPRGDIVVPTIASHSLEVLPC